MKFSKQAARLRRKKRIQKKISGTPERPRLVVFRSNANIYAQVVDDTAGVTLASSSTLALGKAGGDKLTLSKETAEKVGREVAKLAKAQNIERVVFDRNGYLYHGRIKALADGAREEGLIF